MPHTQLVELADCSSVAFAQAGSGEPIVLIHGSLCDYRYWGPQFIPLAAMHRVLSLSLGHYFPTRELNRTLPFSWNSHVQQIVQFIDEIVREPVHVVAHSRGAYLAFHLARSFPERLRSVTLADPSGFVQNDEMVDYYALMCRIKTLHTRVMGLISQGETDAGLALFVDSVSCQGTWARSPDGFKKMIRDNAHTLWPQIMDQVPVFLTCDAREITLPVMLVVGEKSPSTFHRNIKWLHQHITGACKITIFGVSHGMNLAYPRAFNQAVLDFIKVNSR
ncbi:alpha/beta hydrolase (plasmid) [Candidatus Vallotia lariciata]|nr:alpha/beta hydrolase [Candidatus Vallotia lariciata]